ncbi:uncharacterized protein LOC130726581 isoform X2 [Lotus japonicus]|uniref:uncharacterized protein LOC130726581 isoform X2 n=1 Tax=Lotus japonicus TaxID=34305 RepID=UPI00258A01D5|nr:uncharacterized protein LOC130726581 isoform X2 [Lotus japonicus]
MEGSGKFGEKVLEEASMNTLLDESPPSLVTKTQKQTEEGSVAAEKFNASVIANEVKGVNVALLALASTVNQAMGLYKDLDSRVNQVQNVQTEMNNKLERVEKYMIASDSSRLGKKYVLSTDRSVKGTCKTQKAGNKKAALKILQDDVINVDTDVSDDEKCPNYPTAQPSGGMGNCIPSQNEQPKPTINPRFQRNLHTVGSTLGPIGAFRRKEESQPLKNSFPTPPSITTSSKVRKLDASVGPSTKEKNSKASGGAQKTKTSSVRIRTGQILPQSVLTKFRPKPEMLLSKSQLQMSAYLFHPDKDIEEPLLRMGTTVVARKDFDSLMSGCPVTEWIMTLITMKITYSQSDSLDETVWCLPPSFAVDVSLGKTSDELCLKYSTPWILPYDTLKYVYIPIMNDVCHWFLMVINIEQHVVYQFDSHLNVEDIAGRYGTINTLREVLFDMLANSKDHASDFLRESLITHHGNSRKQGEFPILERVIILLCGCLVG